MTHGSSGPPQSPVLVTVPPAELAAHPTDGDARHELYLMCDDIERTVEDLKSKGVESTGEISDEGFGLMAALRLAGSSELAIYEPRQPRPLAVR